MKQVRLKVETGQFRPRVGIDHSRSRVKICRSKLKDETGQPI